MRHSLCEPRLPTERTFHEAMLVLPVALNATLRLVALKRDGCRIGSGFIGFHSHVLREELESGHQLLHPKHVH